MTTGEKRSFTSSLKKAAQLFEKNGASVSSQEQWLAEFHQTWMEYCSKMKPGWFTSNTYHTQPTFFEEVQEHLKEMFKEELQTLPVSITVSRSADESEKIPSKEIPSMGHALRPIRSKKKRLQKKYQKQIRQIEQLRTMSV